MKAKDFEIVVRRGFPYKTIWRQGFSMKRGCISDRVLELAEVHVADLGRCDRVRYREFFAFCCALFVVLSMRIGISQI
jgi:hypothetical protein